MSYILIITEKPDVMRRLAEALAEPGSLIKRIDENQVVYYEFKRNNKKYIVVCAVGHLFSLDSKDEGWSYPVFEAVWEPSFKVRKASVFSKKYFDTIKKLATKATDYIVATDYDIEGDVIAYNILRFICNVNDAKRMKFSTLTKDELIEAFNNISTHLNFPQVEAGLTRHALDWLWGINLTRALTLALKNHAQRGFAILSTGRVQGPLLKLLVDRELEIRNFVPKPFWQIQLQLEVDGNKLVANYEKDKIWDKSEAENIIKSCEGKDGEVEDVKKKKYKQLQPIPFNTTDLQSEAYSQFKFSPTQTLNVAETLYQQGFISYPRSASQKLPPVINYRKILQALATLEPYKEFAEELLKKEKLIPREGKGIDPAHPSVHITHEVPDLKKLTPQQRKIYDLICRRTLATFADPAIRESMNVVININENKFKLVGKRTLEEGWIRFYSPYVKFEEQILPELKIGQKVKILKLELLEKQTQPPPRYSQGSIIKELEKRNLGTKCITEDTIIPIINNHEFREVEVKKLFDNRRSLSDERGEISLNSKKLCFCVEGKDLTTSPFNLVSRRKLNKNEKVYEITFEDGSKIKLTEEHLVLIYNENKFSFIPARQLSEGMKVVSSFLYSYKVGDEITFDSFVKKLDKKSKLYAYADLKNWRKNKGMTQKELGKMLNCQQATLAGWEKKMKVPLWIWSKIELPIPERIYSVSNVEIKNPFPLIKSPSLIRVLAHLVGDGSLDRSKLKRENCFDFRYTNKNLDLVKLFVKDIEEIFRPNKKIKIKTDKRDENKFYVQVPAIIGRILGILFEGLISKTINVDEKFYPEFIGAIFDDEGHVYKDEVKIFISNTNFQLIKLLEVGLKKLGFSPYIKENQKKKNFSRSYKIFLYGRDVAKFLEMIPFFHKTRKERIIKNLTENYRYLDVPYLLLEKKVLASLPNTGAPLKEIASITGLSINTVKTCIKNLRKHGYIVLKTIGIQKPPKKKILYYPLKECHKTFYSLLGEKVISSTLFTKTIKSISEINYNKYVYDLINIPTSNFLLGNGVIVHNSTRAEILQTLYDRGYIKGKAIEVNKLGEVVVEALKEGCPRILSERLTRHFEEEMEQVFNSKKKKEEVIEGAKVTLKKILEEFKKKEKEIGKKLLEGLIETRKKGRKIGICPNCGGELRIILSKRSGKRFVGCINFPKCKTAFPIPLSGQITSLNKSCEVCGLPMLQVWKRGKRPFRMCLNPNCETKKGWNKNKLQA